MKKRNRYLACCSQMYSCSWEGSRRRLRESSTHASSACPSLTMTSCSACCKRIALGSWPSSFSTGCLQRLFSGMTRVRREIGASGSPGCSFDGGTGLNSGRARTVFCFRLCHRRGRLADDCVVSQLCYMSLLPCFGNCQEFGGAARTAQFSC